VSIQPRPPDLVTAPEPPGPLEDAQGLAALAFGSFSRLSVGAGNRHLALLPAETLELDLTDPAQRRFGDYELLEHIGEGGMGVVYRARQGSLDRDVAVKLLSAGPWASREFIARFEREAQNAARMQHPNIVTVYEVGSVEGLHFFSMRLVSGESLSTKLRRGERMPAKAAAALVRTIAEAVDYAHNLGVLHLDLKPGNVLLDEAGTPYVTDFGLARRLENALAIENDEISGTPAYMAPEQAQVRAHKLTKATDIWGLGAILYELLTGEPPFRGETAQDTVRLVLEGQVRAPRRQHPALSPDLEAIVLRCLNRDPAGRYPSARALADDLQQYIAGRPVNARPLNAMQRASRWAKREPKLAATAGCALAALVIGLVVSTAQWKRAEASANTSRENLWATRAQTAQQALAKGDGFRSLRPLVANLEEMERAGNTRGAGIERQRIGTILANAPQLAGLLRVPAGQSVTSLAIAPDGRHLAVATSDWGNDSPERFVRQYDLRSLRQTWATSTRNRTFLMAYGDAGAPHGGLHYTADGRHLLVRLTEQPVVPAPRYSDMIALDAGTGRVVWPSGLPARQADIVYDDVLKHALVRFRSDESLRWPDSGQFYEVDGWKPIGPRHTVATTLAADFWLPLPGGRAWLGTRDCTDFALYDVPALVPRWQLRLPASSVVRAWQFSHDERLLALGSVDGAVRIVSSADGTARTLGSGPDERVIRVEFSADDRTLAAIDENGRLWSWDVATGLPRSAPLQFAKNDGVAALIRFAGDTVFGGGNGLGADTEIEYATLVPHAPFNNETVRGAVRLHGLTAFGTAFDVSTSARLMVTTGGDRLIQVWRLPPLPLLAGHAAPMQPLEQAFDGSRLATVDGQVVSVVDATSGAPLSPPLTHPEPVRFAELAPDGHVLVTIAGRTVRVIDTETWKLRGTPMVLPQTPERAAISRDSSALVVFAATYEGGERHMDVQRIGLASGSATSEMVRIDAIQSFDLDEAGRHAFVATWSRSHPTEFKWISLVDGKTMCAPGPANGWYAILAADGPSAWYYGADGNGSPAIARWDLATCRKLFEVAGPRLSDQAVFFTRGDGLVVHRGGKRALITFDARGRQIAAVGDAIDGVMQPFVVSADGERAAMAGRNSVHLLDTRTGRRLSAPLMAPIAGDDAITKLVFSPDGTRLVARTLNHRWLYWHLPPALPSAAELLQLAHLLDPDPSAPPTDGEIDAMQSRLRAHNAIPRELPDAPAQAIAFAPVAGAGVDPRFVPLDLASASNVPMVGRVWPEPFAGGDLPTLAPGLQRLLGVDYRIDGGVQLSGGGTATAIGPTLLHSAVVTVPDIVASRVHVLAFMHIPMNLDVPSRPFARVVLIGADGHETPLEIRTIRDVITHAFGPKAFPSSGARVALLATEGQQIRAGGDPGQPRSSVYAVTLEVPKGAGKIRGLRFDVADGPMEAPLFYAATLERADGGIAKARVSPAVPE
jgi:WD40 repeat protein